MGEGVRAQRGRRLHSERPGGRRARRGRGRATVAVCRDDACEGFAPPHSAAALLHTRTVQARRPPRLCSRTRFIPDRILEQVRIVCPGLRPQWSRFAHRSPIFVSTSRAACAECGVEAVPRQMLVVTVEAVSDEHRAYARQQLVERKAKAKPEGIAPDTSTAIDRCGKIPRALHMQCSARLNAPRTTCLPCDILEEKRSLELVQKAKA